MSSIAHPARNSSYSQIRPNSMVPSTTARSRSRSECAASAIVYCEANFGAIDGKTANGLVRHSEKYKILSVIDSEKAGQDSGVALGDKANAIPIHSSLADASRCA